LGNFAIALRVMMIVRLQRGQW